jgi:hypothetical protein
VPEPRAPGSSGAKAVTVAAGAGLTLVSAVVAICAGLVSRGAWRPNGVTLPWGLALAMAGSVSLVVVTRLVAGRRPGLLAAGGWLLGVAVVLFWHPGGDYLFANDGPGYLFLLGGTVAVLVSAGWGGPPSPAKPPPSRPRSSARTRP